MRNRHDKRQRDHERKLGGRNKRHQEMPSFAPSVSAKSELEVELHGLNAEQAERRVILEIESASEQYLTICFIHGFTRGNVLKTVVSTTLRRFNKRFFPGFPNPGRTTVYLDH